jgi:ABC-type transport system involved in multi-copper enzyme maturation permease subunit
VSAALSRAGLAKELRALLVPWLLVMAAVAMARLTKDVLVVPIAAVGATGLGAWSMGHEYSHRTLPLLLSQPRDRRAIWVDKVVALGMLIALLSLTTVIFFRYHLFRSEVMAVAVAVGGSGAAALTLTPWLTMLARSARGGMVFTIAVLLMGYLVGTWAGETIAVRYPDTWPDPKALAWNVVTWSFLVVVAATAVLGWRTFVRLSAIDERTEHLTLPEFGRAAGRALSRATDHRHPIVALFRKELVLQVPVFVVSVVYVIAWFGGWMLRPSARESLVLAATYLHGMIVPLLAGSLASSEERRMGVLATQLLQPVSAQVQWVIKAAVVVGLAMVLAVGLPALLQLMDPSVLVSRGLRQTSLGSDLLRIRNLSSIIAVVAMAAALSLYVSSLVSNSLHALLASIAAGVAFAFVLGQAMSWVIFSQSQFVQSLVKMRAALPRDRAVLMGWQLHVNAIRNAYQDVVLAMTVLVVVGGVLLFVRHGSENHRFSDHRPARVAVQIASILLLPVIALLGFYALPAWFLGR